jgi:hypothetical protein
MNNNSSSFKVEGVGEIWEGQEGRTQPGTERPVQKLFAAVQVRNDEGLKEDSGSREEEGTASKGDSDFISYTRSGKNEEELFIPWKRS